MNKLFSMMVALFVAATVYGQDTIPDRNASRDKNATPIKNTAEVEKKSADDEGFVFSVVKQVPITSVKDQHRSSTCWSFSTMAFFEAEVLRTKGITVDLSEMYLVSNSMYERGVLFVRLHGNATFSPGGAFSDGLALLREHGLVPQSAMPGLNYAEYPQDTLPVHKELDAVARGFLNSIVGGNMTRLTPSWKIAFRGIYDAYLGKCPEEFEYEGKKYTPKSFQDYLGLNADDYVSITSFTHHPFYTQFAIEIEDNWRHALSYNVPLEELTAIVDNAINKGYTIAWGSDVSESGFSRQGIAVIPDNSKLAKELGSDMARWLKMNKSDFGGKFTSKPGPELEITQLMRQQSFDNYETTDDHGMLIYGIAKDQTGKEYYIVKNSWGDAGNYNGIWYVSKAFFNYKTINIVVNKKAIPSAIAKKLGIK